MSKGKLAGCDAVGKQIAQSSRKENSNPFIYIHFFAQNIDSIRNKRTGNSHGKGVCSKCGKSSVCQKNRLEQKNDQSQNGNSGRTEENGSETGSGHM